MGNDLKYLVKYLTVYLHVLQIEEAGLATYTSIRIRRKSDVCITDTYDKCVLYDQYVEYSSKIHAVKQNIQQFTLSVN